MTTPSLLEIAERPDPALVSRKRTRTSRTDLLADFFKRHPNTWLHSDELASVAGKCGWRTRVSNCRTQHGMAIENKLERIRCVDRFGEDAEYVSSFYRYVVPAGERQE